MATTQPIKSMNEVEDIKNYYLNVKHSPRNYALFCTGINTALRISDILSLRWRDVYDFKNQKFKSHVTIREKKTDKQNIIALNSTVKKSLSLYKKTLKSISDDDYLFAGKSPDKPICRQTAFRIIKRACAALKLPDNISCHSLRKTFGYHAYIAGVNPAMLMIIYNHSSFDVTKRYLGIAQDDKDNLFLHMNL